MRLDWSNGELAEGLRCFSRQEFFAAHEHWESVWLRCEQPQKSFLQALIQVASAFHHHQRNNRQGAASLLKRAQQRLEAFPTHFEHIDVAELRSAIAESLRALQADPPKAFPSHPRIHVLDHASEEQKTD